MVRIDMSEYQERHTVSRLVGAPPGYVGYEEGGQLTEAVRRKPYSVVLFDEIEKAHPDVFNTLLQVLDDGRLTDAQGRTVDFRNTVIIMTSNIGSEYLLDGATSDGEIKPDARDRVMAELRAHFRPEFLNRLDDIVLFKPLTQPEIERIVDLMFADLRARLADRQLTLELTEDARRFIAQQGFDPVYGARPLRRFIAREVETRIGRALLAGDVRDGAVIRVGYAAASSPSSYENPRSSDRAGRAGQHVSGAGHVRELRPEEPGSGRGRGNPRAAATATSRCPGSPTPATTRSPRSPRRVAPRRGGHVGALVRAVPHGQPRARAARPRPGGPVKLVKVNVDDAPKLQQRFTVQAIPTLMVLRHGEVIARQAGAAPPAALRTWVEEAIKDR